MPDFDTLSREELIAVAREAFAAVEALTAIVAELKARVLALEEENARLRGGPPNTASQSPVRRKPAAASEQKTRKRREGGYSRKLEEPTEVHIHAPETCPDCGRKLCGGWLHRRRQVIEIPPVRYQVIEHQIWARHCGVCGKRVLPKADIPDAVGMCRMGPRITALVGYLKMRCRVPLRIIQALLQIQFGLKVSLGELAEMLHRAASYGRRSYEELLQEVRGSPGVCADETGWYMNGAYQCLWTFATALVRLYRLAPTRGAVVPKEVLEGFQGVLSSDFYAGYSWYLGEHQYCWAHLLRALHDLREEHDSDPSVAAWVDAVHDLYKHAREYREEDPARRCKERFRFQACLEALASPYEQSDLPQRKLARRIMRFLPHLFVFVEKPEIASDNNLAERSLRPLVIARKVSGGTRSDKGSATIETLMSLFGTWNVRGQNELDACIKLLTAGLPQIANQ